MTTHFDQFPINDPIVKKESGHLSDVWYTTMSTFYMNLVSYLVESGVLLPRLTQDEIDNISAPQAGQSLYNLTIGSAQYYKVNVVTNVGTWMSY